MTVDLALSSKDTAVHRPVPSARWDVNMERAIHGGGWTDISRQVSASDSGSHPAHPSGYYHYVGASEAGRGAVVERRVAPQPRRNIEGTWQSRSRSGIIWAWHVHRTRGREAPRLARISVRPHLRATSVAIATHSQTTSPCFCTTRHTGAAPCRELPRVRSGQAPALPLRSGSAVVR